MRSLRSLAVVPLALVVATACGGSSSGKTASSSSPSTVASSPTVAGSSPASSGPQITIASFAFGSPVTVKAGTKVTVKNTDGVGHTVTADDGKSFNVSVPAGATATFTAPSKPGTYKFHCSIHRYMHGSLIVTA